MELWFFFFHIMCVFGCLVCFVLFLRIQNTRSICWCTVGKTKASNLYGKPQLSLRVQGEFFFCSSMVWRVNARGGGGEKAGKKRRGTYRHIESSGQSDAVFISLTISFVPSALVVLIRSLLDEAIKRNLFEEANCSAWIPFYVIYSQPPPLLPIFYLSVSPVCLYLYKFSE